MADFDAQPVNAGTSKGFSFTSQLRVAAPFTASNMTWVEAENSTAADWAGFYISVTQGVGLSGFAGIFFVAKGAAASEVRVASVPAIMGVKANAHMQYVPIPIPSGTRLSVSCTTETAAVHHGQIIGVLSANFDAEPAFTVYDTGPYDLSNTTTYGHWVAVDAGATADTKGSYTEVSYTSHTNNVLNGDSLASTYDYFGLTMNGNFNLSQATAYFFSDFATGAAASEVIYGGDLSLETTAQEKISYNTPLEVRTAVATSGTRISARCQSSITNSVDRIIGVLLWGAR